MFSARAEKSCSLVGPKFEGLSLYRISSLNKMSYGPHFFAKRTTNKFSTLRISGIFYIMYFPDAIGDKS